MEDTDWRRGAKKQWEAMERPAERDVRNETKTMMSGVETACGIG